MKDVLITEEHTLDSRTSAIKIYGFDEKGTIESEQRIRAQCNKVHREISLDKKVIAYVSATEVNIIKKGKITPSSL